MTKRAQRSSAHGAYGTHLEIDVNGIGQTDARLVRQRRLDTVLALGAFTSS